MSARSVGEMSHKIIFCTQTVLKSCSNLGSCILNSQKSNVRLLSGRLLTFQRKRCPSPKWPRPINSTHWSLLTKSLETWELWWISNYPRHFFTLFFGLRNFFFFFFCKLYLIYYVKFDERFKSEDSVAMYGETRNWKNV